MTLKRLLVTSYEARDASRFKWKTNKIVQNDCEMTWKQTVSTGFQNVDSTRVVILKLNWQAKVNFKRCKL